MKWLSNLFGRREKPAPIPPLPEGIKAANEAINALPPDPPPAPATNPVAHAPLPPVTHRRISPAGIALIKRFEGLARVLPDGRIAAYPDPGTGGEPWTIGWGSTGKDPFNGGRIGPKTIWTREQADMAFERHIAQFEREVRDLLGDAPTTQGQFDALVSFHYNTGALGRSTLLRRHKAGDYDAAAREFARWNRAGGKVLQGLVRRRAAEAALYRRGSR